MTIRPSIDVRELSIEMSRLESCAGDAPDGTYEQAKQIEATFGDIFDFVREKFAEAGLTVPNDDRWREVEAVLYGAVKSSNPDRAVFSLAEGFGEALKGSARNRVIEATVRDRDLLRSGIC